jgi:hypothetical protein
MGFSNRLKKVSDPDVPIPRRVAALCGALTHCHAGYAGGKAEIRREFGWEIGQPVSDDLLVAVAEYLAEQWELSRLQKVL